MGGVNRVVHVIPVLDLIEHERSPDCVCGPHKTKIARWDGSEAVAYAHMSLDGREHRRVVG